MTTTIRLRDGETNILAGLIRDDERHSLIGTPGLASIPFLGRLFARNKDEVVQTDIVMTLTPHIIRGTELQRRGPAVLPRRKEGSPLLYEAPAVPSGAASAIGSASRGRPPHRAHPPPVDSLSLGRPPERRLLSERLQADGVGACFSTFTLLMRFRSTSTTVRR